MAMHTDMNCYSANLNHILNVVNPFQFIILPSRSFEQSLSNRFHRPSFPVDLYTYTSWNNSTKGQVFTWYAHQHCVGGRLSRCFEFTDRNQACSVQARVQWGLLERHPGVGRGTWTEPKLAWIPLNSDPCPLTSAGLQADERRTVAYAVAIWTHDEFIQVPPDQLEPCQGLGVRR